MASASRLTIRHITDNFPINRLDAAAWGNAPQVLVSKYWSGEAAPPSRHMRARALWSNDALYVRFEAVQAEPLVVSDKPNLKTKTIGMWERDVSEIFIARDRTRPDRYYEFEIAPNGEWLDLMIEVGPAERFTDWDYRSSMESAVRIDKGKVIMAVKVPFASMGGPPKIGDVWLGNLFRCVGQGKTRGYLAWRPTRTKEPAFHVPEAFGEFEFGNE